MEPTRYHEVETDAQSLLEIDFTSLLLSSEFSVTVLNELLNEIEFAIDLDTAKLYELLFDIESTSILESKTEYQLLIDLEAVSEVIPLVVAVLYDSLSEFEFSTDIESTVLCDLDKLTKLESVSSCVAFNCFINICEFACPIIFVTSSVVVAPSKPLSLVELETCEAVSLVVAFETTLKLAASVAV
ncbi:MAG TPA: hypothetical protein H9783_03055 [Candidatus Limosilactobacillus faecipullorum]|nr:hypothetical protein [Candidatus Limosilactobacillus faecipullorum]